MFEKFRSPRQQQRYRLSPAGSAPAQFGGGADGRRDRPHHHLLSRGRARPVRGLDRRDLGRLRAAADLHRGLGRPLHRPRQRCAGGVDRLRPAGDLLRRLHRLVLGRSACRAHDRARGRPPVPDDQPADAVRAQRRRAQHGAGGCELHGRLRHRAGDRTLYRRLGGRLRHHPADAAAVHRQRHRGARRAGARLRDAAEPRPGAIGQGRRRRSRARALTHARACARS